MIRLPDDIVTACAPLFEVLQMERAMCSLQDSTPQHTALVEQILHKPALLGRPALAAGLWLYADDLRRSHSVAQGIEGSTGAWWHGIMHRREGDLSNSRYWMRRAENHPLLSERPDLDPVDLVDQIAAAHGADLPELIDLQRKEWQALFEWCAENP